MTQSDAPGRGRVLVVEDEADLQELLQYNLARDGFSVSTAGRGELALQSVAQDPPDLVLLDLMLPGMDGLEVCRSLKSDPATASIPVVMLTAKGEEADVVVGLEMGADDYITKPFSPRVLIARIKAVLRRPAGNDAANPDGDQPAIRVGRLRISPARHEVHVDDKPVDLTATEFRILHLMARRVGRVFTRQQILDALHEGFAAVTDRSVDVQIVALRRKLGDAGSYIRTVRGVGYRVNEEE
ncbi:MAG: response regulator [Planctomycetes bacterium]|nr:response regulator [Planctomycetota bacterium]